MPKKSTPENYLVLLEEAKKQYQQYLEISEIYKLPTFRQEEPVYSYRTPTPDNPLTTHTAQVSLSEKDLL